MPFPSTLKETLITFNRATLEFIETACNNQTARRAGEMKETMKISFFAVVYHMMKLL